MMDRAFRAPMSVQILLAEDSNATKPIGPPSVWHCGQVVDGELEVITDGEFVFEIDVSFEGH
jgi:hypothetical protein